MENNLEIVANDNVNEKLFEQIHALDNKVFKKMGQSSSEGFLRKLFFSEHKEAMFCLVDKENDKLAGHLLRLFISENARDRFLTKGGYSKLQNLGIQKGDNIMYHHSVVVDEKYRHTNAIKLLEYSFVKWLAEKQQEGKKLRYVFCTVVDRKSVV